MIQDDPRVSRDDRLPGSGVSAHLLPQYHIVSVGLPGPGVWGWTPWAWCLGWAPWVWCLGVGSLGLGSVS